MEINQINSSKKFFTELRTELYATTKEMAKSGVGWNLLLRFSAPGVALSAVAISIAECVSEIAETVFKGFVHIFCLSDDSSILLGFLFVTGAAIATPFKLIGLVFTVVVGGGVDTIGIFLAPETYSDQSEKIYREKRAKLNEEVSFKDKLATI